MRRVFRHGKSFGPWWHSDSLLQGCPISVLACNCMFALLARRVNRLCPRVSVSFFLDDSKLRAKQSEFVELDEACRQFQLIDQLSGQQLNAEKCVGWGTTTEARKHASKLVPPQGQVVLHAMSLGMVIPTSG